MYTNKYSTDRKHIVFNSQLDFEMLNFWNVKIIQTIALSGKEKKFEAPAKSKIQPKFIFFL